VNDVTDARRLSADAREALRNRGVRLLQAGRTHTEVAETLAVGLRTVAGWSARFRVSGWEGLSERRRGRRPGEQKTLTVAQQAEIVRLMRGRNPDQLELGEGKLWSRAAVRALIEKRLGVSLSRQTVGRYLRDWRFSSKKPVKQWAEQDPDRVQAWLDHDYPAIQARARVEGAKILWADEMGLRTGQTAGRSYAPVGERAVVAVTGKRLSVNVISAVGNDGTLLFEVFQGSGDEIRFMDFLDKLIDHHPGRKLFVIVDNHSIHTSAAAALWQEEHPQVVLFFLPPYAPKLNPDEYLNNDVHAHVARRRPSSLAELIEVAVAYLHTRTAAIVRNYFKATHVRYAQ
jgi:transposase